jgi:uncharacterized protein DUF1214
MGRAGDRAGSEVEKAGLERRELLKALGVAGATTLLPLGGAAFAQVARAASDAAPAPVLSTESRRAFSELLDLLHKVEAEYLSPARGVRSAEDVVDGDRFLLQLLWGGLDQYASRDAERPTFTRIVTPARKFLGDNPDAIYFSAPVRGDRAYRIRGNTAGAVYTSFTVEGGNGDGSYPKRVVSALSDERMKIDPDGSYEIMVSAESRPGNWLRLEPDAGTLTTRHYFENETSAAADPSIFVPLRIEPLADPGPPARPDDAWVAERARWVANFVRGTTLDQPLPDPKKLPPFVSLVPNTLGRPTKWKPEFGGFGAVDNAYSMGPFLLEPDQALVIEGRMPRCRFANVMLWNRYLQTFEYPWRTISRNRRQMQLGEDGAYRIVIAHRKPGAHDWLDTSGRRSGTIYWRFLLPEEDPPTPTTRVVPVAELG